ncbi:hypothetical protein NIES267_07870 [Calothrix parasitica NIES-267]|uniref:Sulfatase-modifying factor enzyme-like domain-containing protein n=1 Tax=Calothrix parasitica NIES-267 TaxID=1973488 RepID=A0A1Z4LJA8_9CYAN|nr:hypothetical protein NIES267_07870 [Calothrix parasitica NIES-267]
MSDNQQPKPYDAVLGNQNQPAEGAVVLGGIEGVKLRLSNSNLKARIAGIEQALNYGEQGLDLITEFLQNPRTEENIKQALREFNLNSLKLEPFEVLTLNKEGEIIQSQQRVAKYFAEDLGNGINLEMAYIPGGTFIMGAPETEEGSNDSERPQHQVTVPPFYMGKYPIIREQWIAIAMPQIDITNIIANQPSFYKSKYEPIEHVDWYDAVKFCASLSKATGKRYRLPSEAEWEYACRAGTTTPFHYGETISEKLVTYKANSADVDKIKARWKGRMRFGSRSTGKLPPNAFGLYDMHSDFWEWCEDTEHPNYEGAPTDGSAWVHEKGCSRILRGSSWRQWQQPIQPKLLQCRSALRDYQIKEMKGYHIGFRVVCDLF